MLVFPYPTHLSVLCADVPLLTDRCSVVLTLEDGREVSYPAGPPCPTAELAMLDGLLLARKEGIMEEVNPLPSQYRWTEERRRAARQKRKLELKATAPPQETPTMASEAEVEAEAEGYAEPEAGVYAESEAEVEAAVGWEGEPALEHDDSAW